MAKDFQDDATTGHIDLLIKYSYYAPLNKKIR